MRSTEAHGGEHGAFPPFDPATFGSQLFWLAICFGGALPPDEPRGAAAHRRHPGDARATASPATSPRPARLKQETDAAIAAYEQALAEARQNAHGDRAEGARRGEGRGRRRPQRASRRICSRQLDAAEARIGEVKARALAEVDAIAKDAAEAMVEVLIGAGVGKAGDRRARSTPRMAERA